MKRPSSCSFAVHVGGTAQADGVCFDWAQPREGSQQESHLQAIGNLGKPQGEGGYEDGVGVGVRLWTGSEDGQRAAWSPPRASCVAVLPLTSFVPSKHDAPERDTLTLSLPDQAEGGFHVPINSASRLGTSLPTLGLSLPSITSTAQDSNQVCQKSFKQKTQFLFLADPCPDPLTRSPRCEQARLLSNQRAPNSRRPVSLRRVSAVRTSHNLTTSRRALEGLKGHQK